MCKTLEGWKPAFLPVGLFIPKFMHLPVKFKTIRVAFHVILFPDCLT